MSFRVILNLERSPIERKLGTITDDINILNFTEGNLIKYP